MITMFPREKNADIYYMYDLLSVEFNPVNILHVKQHNKHSYEVVISSSDLSLENNKAKLEVVLYPEYSFSVIEWYVKAKVLYTVVSIKRTWWNIVCPCLRSSSYFGISQDNEPI